MNLNEKYKSLFSKYKVNTSLRIAHFMSQLEHESNLEPISENLNYSSKGLNTTFKKYFPAIKDTIGYERKPLLIANKVYANRMGNGAESSGDGWKYRGRGFIQLTGKDNYASLAKDTGLDCLKNPDLLLEEANAIIAALWFWDKNKLNDLADKDDCEGVTKKINGGYHGLDDRKRLLLKWKKIIK
jgi:putative chitinase